MLALDRAERLDELDRARRQRAYRRRPCRRSEPHDERLASEVVHCIDGVPRALVAHANGLGGTGDGAGFADRREQRDSRRAAERIGARTGTRPNRRVPAARETDRCNSDAMARSGRE